MEKLKKDLQLSIVIPTYQNTEFLYDCINSLMYSAGALEYEILVGIDCCYKTLASLEKYRWICPERIKFYFFSKNLGPYVIRNTLAEKARSETILFFDSDDIMIEGAIEKIVEKAETHNIVKFDFYNFYNGLDYKKERNLIIPEHKSHGAFVINKKLFFSLGGFLSWRCGADTEFFERYVAMGYTDHKIEEALFFRRYHETNISRTKNTDIRSDLRKKYAAAIYEKRKTGLWKPTLPPETFACDEVNVGFGVAKLRSFDGVYSFVTKKEQKDMAVILCHFSWEPIKNSNKKLLDFLDAAKAEEIPIYGIELSVTGNFVTGNDTRWKRVVVEPKNVSDSKELYINTLVRRVPEKYKKIAWVDTDNFEFNKNWYRETSIQLNRHKIIQMLYAGSSEKSYVMKSAGGKTIVVGGYFAANREFWKSGGGYGEILNKITNQSNQSDTSYFQTVDKKMVIPKKEIVVYTCISGRYDRLEEIKVPEKNIDYVCFTDQDIQSSTWKIQKIPEYLKDLDDTRRSRCVKLLPHLFLPEHNISVWVDGNISVLGNITELVFNNLKNNFVVPKHPLRTCIKEEAAEIILRNKDDEETVTNQLNEYLKEGHPENFGMVQTNVLIRRHNEEDCKLFGEMWWKEILTRSKRDQMSFNYVLRKNPLGVDILNPSIIVSKYFQAYRHNSSRVNLPIGYGDMKNYINGKEV